ncbi:MAG: ABC transporter permease [Bacteroidales bacterium]|nr:ABC transporter permease [Bacteroidales bacterium]
MKVNLFLARRLSLASGHHKSSPAVKVSIIAVALSIAVMLISIAVVVGFKREIRDKVTGFNSHISIYLAPNEYDEDQNLISLNPGLASILEDQDYISEYSLEASIPIIFKTPSDFKGVYLRSVNSNHLSDFIKNNLDEGRIPDYSQEANRNKIVISRIAAREVGLKAGDKIDTYFISDNVKVRRLEVAGVFNTHFDSYDKFIAFGALPLIQGIAGIRSNQGTAIQIETDDPDLISDYSHQLNKQLTEGMANGLLYKEYLIDNAHNQGAAYFNWLSLLDTNVIVVLALMTIVAVATLISGMLILILDKKRMIGIVRALGASTISIRNIFVYLALKVAFLGIIIGNVFTLALLICQKKWHFIPLDADAYYMDYVPIEINLWSILALNIGSIIIIYLCLLFPSRYVAQISPSEAMRADE